MVGYTEAGIALLLSGVLILYVRRLETGNPFQKRLLIFSVVLLIAAVLSNLLIGTVLLRGSPEDVLVYSKKLQALFDHFLGLSIGAFVMATVTPSLMSHSDLWRHIAERRPPAYIAYNAIFILGIVAVIIAPAHVEILPGDGGFTFSFPAWFLAALFVVAANFIFFVTYKLLAYMRRVRSTPHVAQQTSLMLLGLNGYTISELVFEIILPSAGFDLRGIGFVVEIMLIALVAFALRERGILQQLIVPRPEAYRETEKKFHLETGTGYLVVEEKPTHAFEVFTDLVTHGFEGLCITRRAPARVAGEFGLERTPILWLSRVVNQKNCLRPSPAENVALAIEHFVAAGEQGVVLLDGLEYLIAHNDFNSILTLIHDISESIALHDSIFIVPLDPMTVEEQQFALVKRELVLIEAPQLEALADAENGSFVSLPSRDEKSDAGVEMES